MRRLIVTSGPAAGRKLELDADLVIGREGADLTIQDPDVSRNHAVIRPTEHGVVIEDLGSTNGTFVDGRRIAEPVTVTTDAEIRVGDSKLALELRPEEAPAGKAAAGTPRRPRRAVLALGVLVLVAAVAAGLVLALGGDSDETETHDLDANVTTLPFADPTSFQISGVLRGEPLGRVAVVIQRRLAYPPQAGVPPPAVRGFMLVTTSDGNLSLNFDGTLRATRGGGEVVQARGTAGNGTRDFEGVKGSFRLTGGRSSPRSRTARFKVTGKLEY